MYVRLSAGSGRELSVVNINKWVSSEHISTLISHIISGTLIEYSCGTRRSNKACLYTSLYMQNVLRWRLLVAITLLNMKGQRSVSPCKCLLWEDLERPTCSLIAVSGRNKDVVPCYEKNRPVIVIIRGWKMQCDMLCSLLDTRSVFNPVFLKSGDNKNINTSACHTLESIVCFHTYFMLQNYA